MTLAQALRIPPRFALVALAVCGGALAGGAHEARADGDIVISQVYGGGGNTGSTLTNDFVELFNRSLAPVSITGWTLQYAATTGSTWQSTVLSGTIPVGGYYLIEEANGGQGSVALPTPDASGNINLSATGGKCALVRSGTSLSGTCPTPADLVDFVGYNYGLTNCFEGSAPTPAPNITNSVQRYSQGCTDSDDNYSDFFVAPAAPRNSASALNECHSVPTNPSTWAKMKASYR
ncbi:MAG TPA: lamin tail domain-containing protein [Candidatus Eisenbacteria bacterium]|jgi:hypothetical protein|nr:lamin tail domain-containing protein [Candidatus Eisenbacteria bacterium]